MPKNPNPAARLDMGMPLGGTYIDINGTVYAYDGESSLEGVCDAVSTHVNNDLEFTEYIRVAYPDSDKEEYIYSPAILCTLGYLTKEDLARMILPTLFDGETTDGENA